LALRGATSCAKRDQAGLHRSSAAALLRASEEVFELKRGDRPDSRSEAIDPERLMVTSDVQRLRERLRVATFERGNLENVIVRLEHQRSRADEELAQLRARQTHLEREVAETHASRSALEAQLIDANGANVGGSHPQSELRFLRMPARAHSRLWARALGLEATALCVLEGAIQRVILPWLAALRLYRRRPD
jgi:septal ring factor EnvC (AmiA/AmiB activator)